MPLASAGDLFALVGSLPCVVGKPEISKPRPESSRCVSHSAAELFARVVQLEKRGVVLGDRSSGSVMEAKRYSYQMGTETVIFYGQEPRTHRGRAR